MSGESRDPEAHRNRGEVRVDPLRGWTTRVAPLRGERPHDPALVAGGPPGAAAVDTSIAPAATGPQGAPGDPARAGNLCPFCPGHEAELGEILAEVPPTASPQPGGSDEEGRPGQSRVGWQTRAVANRYPFVPEGGGWQEVLVDTPRHGADLASMTRAERVAALTLYRDRMAAAYERSPGAEVHLFRNQGRDAGSSRAHPHGQLVALEGATTPGRTQLEAAQREAYAAGTSIIDRTVRGETDAEYHVARGVHLVAWVLHAPLDPGHLRIAPVERAVSFSTASAGLLIELAELLGALAACLPGVAGTADHNLLFHDHGNHPGDPALHWHLELRPRVSRLAGFEQMSATGVSSSDPARDAALLRGAMPFEFRP